MRGLGPRASLAAACLVCERGTGGGGAAAAAVALILPPEQRGRKRMPPRVCLREAAAVDLLGVRAES